MKILRNISLVFLALLSLVTVTTFVNAQTTANVNVANVKKTVVDYPLPYPGILPDNVLYPLKTLRDRSIEFLTIDPLKKAEFYLLQADKRAASSIALTEKGKYLLAEQTLSKGEKYFLQSLSQIKVAKEKGKDTRDVEDRARRATAKHTEVISLLLTRMPKEFQDGITGSEAIVKDIEKSLEVTTVPTNTVPEETITATPSSQTSE